MFDGEKIRRDFPILTQKINGKPLVYLDSAATSQKPKMVLEAILHYYEADNANIHRGVHTLSERATRAFEEARNKVQKFVGAKEGREIIFVRGTTEGINLVASTFGRTRIQAGDEILISTLEHHSNIVPWQILCQEKGARLRVIPINDCGELLMEEYQKLLTPKTKLVAITHISNALGTITPIHEIIRLAHERKIPVLVDGAQAVPHTKVDVREMDCDFYVFSGHKMYGPTGIGVLYGKAELLESMPPYQGGGDMISAVTFEKTTYNVLPYKFEAGTPDISGVIGLGTAIDYLEEIGIAPIAKHESELLQYATEALSSLEGIRLIGTAKKKACVLSFVMEGIHPHDIGTILDREGIAIRTGHHCAMPLMERLGVPATARVSFGLYNRREEVDRLLEGLKKVKEIFRP
ncbi:MAG: cysteine desulfurase [Deltaproteobacteria bacterium]|nr:cysteine desulfurase [Deltaproteobacteria bacterium]